MSARESGREAAGRVWRRKGGSGAGDIGGETGLAWGRAAAGPDAAVWIPQSGRSPARPKQSSCRPSSVIPSWAIIPGSAREASSGISEI